MIRFVVIVLCLIVTSLAQADEGNLAPSPTIDWTAIVSSIAGLLAAVVAAWRAHSAAKAASSTKNQVSGISTKLDNVVVQLDGALAKHIEEIRVASEAVGVKKERDRREALDQAILDSRRDPRKD